MQAPTNRGSEDRRAHGPGAGRCQAGLPTTQPQHVRWVLGHRGEQEPSTLHTGRPLSHHRCGAMSLPRPAHRGRGGSSAQAPLPISTRRGGHGPGAPLLRTWHPSLLPAAEKCCGSSSVSHTCSLLPRAFSEPNLRRPTPRPCLRPGPDTCAEVEQRAAARGQEWAPATRPRQLSLVSTGVTMTLTTCGSQHRRACSRAAGEGSVGV